MRMFGGLVLAFPINCAQSTVRGARGVQGMSVARFLPFLVASPLLFMLVPALV